MRWLIGVELARHRRDAGLSLAQVSAATGIGRPKLGHMETGLYRQHADDISTVLGAYGVPSEDIARVAALAGHANARTWWAPWESAIPEWMRTMVGLEGMAEREFLFEPLVIPGLLQTEDYALALTQAAVIVRPDRRERVVSFRRERAARLTAHEPLDLHVVIGEAALGLSVGDEPARRHQLEHLIRMAQQPNVAIQVIRPEGGSHGALAVGQFMALKLPETRPVVYVELLDGACYIHEPDLVTTYTMVADTLRQVALSPAESLALIKGLVSAA
ncbi:helix-turn-helix domain-containing protein [Longispora fulva]|uniref:Transcriptional regulator with XRE-family HTH domain n=1 Tax=Longispora fulva TaxID=619741 RepID=A0A8J7H4D8_9ACTN|nr:helix-turn-helix transcriptional regulator [Longispora fulva]MBG6141238.1 transcriptional regulator with XRE-family HTH domain [Longispora fulva]